MGSLGGEPHEEAVAGSAAPADCGVVRGDDEMVAIAVREWFEAVDGGSARRGEARACIDNAPCHGASGYDVAGHRVEGELPSDEVCHRLDEDVDGIGGIAG